MSQSTAANPGTGQHIADKPASRPAAIRSPCVRICVIEPISSLCIGCGRSMREIGAWPGYAPQMRAAIMAELPSRLAWLRAARPEAFSDSPPGTD